MSTLIKRTLKAARNYTVVDYACLKITLLSAGIIIGTYFPKFFLSHSSLLWLVFIVTYIWIMYRTFVQHMN